MRTTRLRRLTTAIISGLAIALVLTLVMMLGGGMNVVFAEDQPDGSTIIPIQIRDGTWGPGTITATTDVVIQAGVVITIAPDTTILVADDVSITVNGDLHSDGPVTFTGVSATPGAWEGITFALGSSGHLDEGTIEYAQRGLTLNTSNPITISNSTIRYNQHTSSGAGIYIQSGDHLISDSHIYDNVIEGTGVVYGGGIFIENNSSQVIRSRVHNNSASSTGNRGGGAGIMIRRTSGTVSPLIQYCEITTNTLVTTSGLGSGAGIGIEGNTQAEIRNNLISDNQNVPTGGNSGGGGIGFYTIAQAALIDGNVIANNLAWGTGHSEGGGIDGWGSNIFVASNNLLVGNRTRTIGGAMNLNGTISVFNNTIIGNTAQNGGGLYRQSGSNSTYNNIIVSNTATEDGGGVYGDSGSAGYNNVWSNTPNDYNASPPPTDIQVDPLFLGTGDLVQQFHLRQNSPVIDTGTNTGTGLPNVDFDGQARPLDTTWDIGFDEVDPFSYAKLVDRDTVSGGLPLVYSIVITNPDPHATLIGGQVTDVLPANTSYSAGPNCNLGSCAYDNGTNTITWTGDVPAGTVLTLDYTVLADVGLAEGSEITNQAEVSVGTVSGTTNEVTTVVHNPDLSVTKSANPEPVEAGDVLNYSIVIANKGPGDATGVTVSDPSPANTQFVPGSIVLAPPDAGTAGTVPPTLATDVRINAGESVEISYQVTVDKPLDAGTIIENVTTVTSTQDPTPATGGTNSTVSTTPAVNVVKSGPDRANAGDTAVFTFAVTNVGNTLLHNVDVEDDYAGPGVYVSGDDGDGWLDLTEAWIYTASYTIQPEDPTPLINTVVVTATDAFGTQTTDNDTHSIGLGPPPGSIFLPIIISGQTSDLPDLVVESLIATSDTVTITIRNQSDVDVNDAFWVDVYFDPSETPGLNQPWDTIASYGVVWGVTTSIPAGSSLTLTTGGDYYFPEYSSSTPLPVEANVYALVDSINYATSYGAVRESDENNNLFGPVTSTTGVTGGAARIGGQSQPASREGLPTR